MISIVAAPTNLGLRPPQATSVPGGAKAPDALREAGLYRRLEAAGAEDDGVVIAGRYVDDVLPGSGRVRNQDALVDYTVRLAGRIGGIISRGRAPLVLGGDCSVLLGAGVALARAGRYGLVHVDGHTDFRHPGNSDQCASVAGEDLAAAVGLHLPEVSDIEGLRPYFLPQHVVHVGCRDDDEGTTEATQTLAAVIPARQVVSDPDGTLSLIRKALAAQDLEGYWLHVDVDVLDPAFMPAVDSPDPGGLNPQQLITLLGELAADAVGAAVCILDPDLDPDGSCAQLVADVTYEALSDLGAARTTVVDPELG
ncbi:arginase family protein [Kribbella sancticallisti]|uniref:Arginase family protein n=1 Tax=Kribbella sancticallisti TaxID=460087 RepID=A0ABP4NJE0_9ACTN